jgi:hypothetical protein
MEHVGSLCAPVMTAAVITLITYVYDPTLGQDARGVLVFHKRIVKLR